MPLHDFSCPRGHVTEHFVLQGVNHIVCAVCLEKASKVFLKAPVGFVQRDICYDSPIDGRAITNKQARIEDLARHECVEYDPGMRQDAARRRKEADESLDRSVDQTVEQFFAAAPTRKLEKLAEEMHAGVSLEVNRASPDPSALT